MKKLANSQVADRHSDFYPPSHLRVFGNIKFKALKAAKAIALAVGGITTSLLLATTSLASTNQIRNSTATNGARELPSHTAIEDEKVTKGIVSNPPITRLIAAPSRQVNKHDIKGTQSTKTNRGKTEKEQETTSGKARYGKLTLVNDTASPMLIYLQAPSKDRPPRYAYLPGCTTRQLKNAYSTGWRVSTDLITSAPLGEIRSGQLGVRASSLQKGLGGVECSSRERISVLVSAMKQYGQDAKQLYATVAASDTGTAPYTEFSQRLRDAASSALAEIGRADRTISLRNKLKDTETRGALAQPQKQLAGIIDQTCILPQQHGQKSPTQCPIVIRATILSKFNKWSQDNVRGKIRERIAQIASEKRSPFDTEDEQFITDIMTVARGNVADINSLNLAVKAYLETNCGITPNRAHDEAKVISRLALEAANTHAVMTEAIPFLSQVTNQQQHSTAFTAVVPNSQNWRAKYPLGTHCVIRGGSESHDKVVSF